MTDKRRWVVTGVSDETRRAVVAYAELRGQTIAQVLEDELHTVREHMRWVLDQRRVTAEAEAGPRTYVVPGLDVEKLARRELKNSR